MEEGTLEVQEQRRGRHGPPLVELVGVIQYPVSTLDDLTSESLRQLYGQGGGRYVLSHQHHHLLHTTAYSHTNLRTVYTDRNTWIF
jgi:hypothetical protein